MDIAETPAKTNSSTKTPGSFTPEEAAAAFGDCFMDNYSCRMWILQKLHPDGAQCPSCNKAIKDDTTLNNFWTGNRCTCKHCGRWFTAISETFLQGAQLSSSKVLLLAVLADYLAKGLNVQRLADTLDISPDTVRIWIRRFKAIDG